MSLYALKDGGAAGGSLQPWSSVLTLSEAGDNLALLAALYDKRPETSITTALTLATVLDGPIQVHRFGDVTLNGATLTALNPCRGLFLIFDSLTVTGTASTVHMNGKGCQEGDIAASNLSIPASLSLSSQVISYNALLRMIRATGYYIGDPGFWASQAAIVQGTLTHGASLIVDSSQCGAGGAPGAGGAGARGTGGGGQGNCNGGDDGLWWRGGFGGVGGPGTAKSTPNLLTSYPGAPCIVIVLGALTATAALNVQSNGLTSTGYYQGGAGGGVAAVLYGSKTGTVNVTADGGAASGTALAGGAGYTVQSTLAAWGVA